MLHSFLAKGGAVRGAALLLAGLVVMTVRPGGEAQARPDAYWPLLCRGPLPQLIVDEGMMTLTARAGRRAARPAAGECVWLDRGVRRRGEMLPNGRMIVRLRIDGGPRLVSRAGRVRLRIVGDPRARRIWRANRRGEVFRIAARRSGRGIYDAQYEPTAWPGGYGPGPMPPEDDMMEPAGPWTARVVIDSVRVHSDGDRHTPGDWFMTFTVSREGSANADGRRWPARGTVDVRDGRTYRPPLQAMVYNLRRGDVIRVQVTATDCDGNGLLDLGAMLPGEPGDVFREMRRMMSSDGCSGEEINEFSRRHDVAGLSFRLPPRIWRRGGTFTRRIRGNGLDFTITGHVELLR